MAWRKFQKKPVVIEAIQYLPGTNDEEVMMFLNGCTGWHMSDTEPGIIIPTLEGNFLTKRTDWIIKGISGEFYPCKTDIFNKTYTEVYN